MGIESIQYPLEDGVSMPFIREGDLWVYCMICDEAVRIADSTSVSANETLRACKEHYSRFKAEKGDS
jgi:hypothetical protein